MAFKNKDFIEIEFTGTTTDGEVFDSNIKSDLEKIGSKQVAKPFTFVLGEGMFLPGIEEFLVGKEAGKYTINLTPEKAFGKRDLTLVQLVPESVFRQHNVRPITGMVFNFDGKLGKVVSANGGRVRVDFNNPLSGKDVVYQVNVLRDVKDTIEKVKALNDFLFRTDLKFSVDNKKLTIESPKKMAKFIELFKPKYKDILELDLEVKEVEEKAN